MSAACSATLRVGSLLFAIAAVLAVTASHVAAQTRGTSREKAVLVESNEVTDDLDGSGDAYFYKFVAGPGKVTITLEVEANETNAGATIDVFGSGSKAIVSNVLAEGVDKGSETVERTVNLSKQQGIVIRVKGIKYGEAGGTGTYTITVRTGDKKVGGDIPKTATE